jgi:ribosome-dependent ATPase
VSTPVARVAGATLRYRGLVALDAVDLELPAGGISGFVGPDGVGKSSLLALLAGARRIQSGSVEVLGGSMADAGHRRSVCPRIAYMPQGLGRNLYATLSVTENLDFFGRLFGQPRADRKRRIDELLHATGLAPFPDRAAGQLSGGMRQKLGLCCALIHDPDLLILDEPTTGVDPLSRRQFWELIGRIRARRPHMSVLVATAYFDEAEGFDRLVAMDAGRILACEAPGVLKARQGAATLEEAFVALLPPARRGGGRFRVPARVGGDGPVAIEAHGLTRKFGEFVAVDGVSFRIRRGEIFGFLGSNGCGKTTTMKILTGLLPATAGTARIFESSVDGRDLEMRRRVGFMSQSFSLYTELTVRQNLALHARLFHLPRARIGPRIDELVRQFGLGDCLDQTAENLPLGVRQRLSLAVAVIHEPELLILDEPTSGVDPVARDRFWELLVDLSRNRGVTIFVSTHFMNEAERCDRISLMHAGRVLAQGAPADIVRAAGAASLEQAFIAHLEAAARAELPAPADPGPAPERAPARAHDARFSPRRLWAYTWREGLEVLRDPIRLAFAILGPAFLMVVFGFGITFDIEHLAYATLDRDRSPESRAYLDGFAHSRYFEQRAPLADAADLERRMRTGELRLSIEIPPGFGRDLRAGRSPEVAVWLDGAFPFRAETSRDYTEGVHRTFLHQIALQAGRAEAALPAGIEARFRYNQEFLSVYAVVPGVLMLLLVMIPAMMSALGVVREKELGSITNLYATPVTGLEFLLGKQLPYVAVALVNVAMLWALALLLFHVPVKGSAVALAAGATLYVIASTGFGLLVSSFVRTQIAAIFAAAILSSLPAIQYSGFLLPVSSMSADAQAIGYAFPSIYFQRISVGAFTKGLDLARLAPDLVALLAVCVATTLLARAGLRTQER